MHETPWRYKEVSLVVGIQTRKFELYSTLYSDGKNKSFFSQKQLARPVLAWNYIDTSPAAKCSLVVYTRRPIKESNDAPAGGEPTKVYVIMGDNDLEFSLAGTGKDPHGLRVWWYQGRGPNGDEWCVAISPDADKGVDMLVQADEERRRSSIH